MATVVAPNNHHQPPHYQHHHEQDVMIYPESQQPQQTTYNTSPMDMNMSPDGFSYPPNSGFEVGGAVYAEAPNFMYNGKTSPGAFPTSGDGEMHMPSSNLSSAPSSTVGSPHSNHGQMPFFPEYQHQPQHQHQNTTGLGVNPGIVGQSDYFPEYPFSAPSAIDDFQMVYEKPGFVDPSLIHPEIRGAMAPPLQGFENSTFSPQNNHYPASPAISGGGSPVSGMRNGSHSPYMHGGYQHYSPFALPSQHGQQQPPQPHHHQQSQQPQPQQGRRPSMSSFQSHGSHEYMYSGDESREKQRCPHPDCGKIYKDLKAHMLTHQNERPEKCPIQTCDYHTKGFARKYDKNRHTLTHYKGTMVCGFCPGSGSAAEKSFNRADVFKRHLTAVHGVEQTPPNSRKKTTTSSASAGKKLTGYAPDATGKCSTCSATFANAQDFYEHLDDCVLRIVQQEDPAEAINAQRLAEVENDEDVIQTLEKNQLPLTTPQAVSMSDDDDDDMDDDDVLDDESRARKLSSPKKKTNPANGVQKSRGITHSRGGVTIQTKSKSRKNRRDYPSSWGFDKGQMTMKKRVMAVFDGPRRLAKDDMMLSTEHEVRVKLSDGKSYVTDLDVNTMKRAEGFLNATDEEKGAWISDDPTEDDVRRMMEMAGQR